MWKKIAVAAVAGAAALGGGAGALAATSDSSTPSTPSTPSAPSNQPSQHAPRTGHHGRGLVAAGKGFEHAEWVSRNGTSNVTHDAIRGTVTAAGPSSVSVKALDGTSMTFTVDSHTKIVLRENGKGSAKKGTAAEVKVNDHVLVAGTKSGTTLTAQRLLDTGTK